jgi:hypothetical protein
MVPCTKPEAEKNRQWQAEKNNSTVQNKLTISVGYIEINLRMTVEIELPR